MVLAIWMMALAIVLMDIMVNFVKKLVLAAVVVKMECARPMVNVNVSQDLLETIVVWNVASEILEQILGVYMVSVIPWAGVSAIQAGRVTSATAMLISLAVGVASARTENVCAHLNFKGLVARCVTILVLARSVSMTDISVPV